MLNVDGLPALTWLADRPGNAAVIDAATLEMVAPSRSDWFNDPMGPSRSATAPAVMFVPRGDFQLAARLTVDFESTFDAGVLFVHQSGDDYAKLCFEYSPDAEPMVVSVVTREVSDDANGPVVGGSAVWLRVSRIGKAYAFHHSVDGQTWSLTRLFSLRPRNGEAAVGFLAQSPLGDGCRVTFHDVQYRPSTLADVRNGT